MPMLKTAAVRHRVAELGDGRDALVVLAERAGIPHGTLRNAVGGRQPLSLPRVYALGRALAKRGEDPKAVAAWIVDDEQIAAEIRANNGGVPDEPPRQPKTPPSPPTRRDQEQTRKGPRRVTSRRVA